MQQNIEITKLPNGLTVITDAMPTVATASLGFWLDVGARHEPEDASGVAHIVEHMMFKGSPTRTAQQIANSMENVGAYMNAHTGKEETAYYCKLLAQDAERGIDIYSDMLINNSLPEDELVRERSVIVQELNQAYDDPEHYLYDKFNEALFPNQLFGRPTIGDANVIADMAREKLRRYIDTNYHTGNAVFIAAGNVQHQQICDWVLKYTKNIKHGPKAEFIKPTFQAANIALPREVEQIHMMLAAPCATHHEPDFHATQVFSQLMGGGFSSRLFTEVREKRGLVYHVSSFNIQYSDVGTFNVYASATPDKAGEVLRVAADELSRVAGTITDEELARAKMQIKARLLMQMESTSARTDRIGDQWHTYGRIIPMSETVAAIDAVTKADVDRVAKGICKGQVAVGTCGPVGQIKDMPDVAARIAA